MVAAWQRSCSLSSDAERALLAKTVDVSVCVMSEKQQKLKPLQIDEFVFSVVSYILFSENDVYYVDFTNLV